MALSRPLRPLHPPVVGIEDVTRNPPSGDYTRGAGKTYYNNATKVLDITKIYFVPLILHKRIIVDALAISLDTGVNGKVGRLGLYSYTGKLTGLLIAQSPEFDVQIADQGLLAISLSVSLALRPNWYWFALQTNGAITVQAHEDHSFPETTCVDRGSGILDSPGHVSAADTYSPAGDLPSSIVSGSLVFTGGPMIAARVA